jgi:hypothetical protein
MVLVTALEAPLFRSQMDLIAGNYRVNGPPGRRRRRADRESDDLREYGISELPGIPTSCAAWRRTRTATQSVTA